jgi:hypothetical protein
MRRDPIAAAERKKTAHVEGKVAWEEYQATAAGVTGKIARLRAARLARDANAAKQPKSKIVKKVAVRKAQPIRPDYS